MLMEAGSPPSERPMGILLVDDHPVVRMGLAAMLGHVGRPVEVHEAANACGALALARSHAPRVALVDLSLAGEICLHLIGKLRQAAPGIAVLVVSMHEERVYAERALRAGAMGYVMKHMASDSVVHAVQTVCAGQVWLSEAMRGVLINRVAGKARTERVDKLAALSEREMQVFRLLGRGFKKADIALRLNLSPNTVETYRAHIKHKLSVDSGAGLYRMAFLHMQKEEPSPE